MSRPANQSYKQWQTLFNELRPLVDPRNQFEISGGKKYRATFRQIFDRHKSTKGHAERYLYGLTQSHQSIIDLARAIDDTFRFDTPSALGTVVWRLLARTLDLALATGINFDKFLAEIDVLNKGLPSFNGQLLSDFSEDQRVQKPLQDLLKAYVDYYMSILSDKRAEISPLQLDKIKEFAPQAEEDFRLFHNGWNLARIAAKKELDSRKRSTSAASSSGSTQSQSNYGFEMLELVTPGNLGEGAFGLVTTVRQVSTGKLFAQKTIKPRNSTLKQTIRAQVQDEIDTMERLPHKHIAQIREVIEDGSELNLIITPVANYDLGIFLEADGHCMPDFPAEKIELLDKWFGCLISALAFAHSEGVSHNDIKPSNILIKEDTPKGQQDAEFVPYLADFGNAWDTSDSLTSFLPGDRNGGTHEYLPPENKRHRISDVFSLGCVFSEMLTVRQGETLDRYRAARQKNDVRHPCAFRENLQGERSVRSWLDSLANVGKRDSIQQSLRAVIIRMIEADPDRRLDAQETKERLRRDWRKALFCGSCGT